MRILCHSIAIVFALMIGAVFATNGWASSLEDVAQSTHKLYVNGQTRTTETGMGVCTAVGVSPTQFVTAAHCIPTGKQREGLSVTQHTYNDDLDLVETRTIYLKVVRTFKDDDTAFVEIRGETLMPKWVEIADSFEPTLGTLMYAVGYPRLEELTLTEGMFTAVSKLENLNVDGRFYKTTIPITGGSSGGGVYSREGDSYKLVGLATARWPDVSFQSYFSTHKALERVTANLLKGTEPEVEGEAPAANMDHIRALIDAEK